MKTIFSIFLVPCWRTWRPWRWRRIWSAKRLRLDKRCHSRSSQQIRLINYCWFRCQLSLNMFVNSFYLFICFQSQCDDSITRVSSFVCVISLFSKLFNVTSFPHKSSSKKRVLTKKQSKFRPIFEKRLHYVVKIKPDVVPKKTLQEWF